MLKYHTLGDGWELKPELLSAGVRGLNHCSIQKALVLVSSLKGSELIWLSSWRTQATLENYLTPHYQCRCCWDITHPTVQRIMMLWKVKPNPQNMQYRELKARPTHHWAPRSPLSLVGLLTSVMVGQGYDKDLPCGPLSESSDRGMEGTSLPFSRLLLLQVVIGRNEHRSEEEERGSAQKGRINDSGTVCCF